MKQLDFWTNFLANVLTVIASGIAICVYIFNKDKIKTAFNSILSYSHQVTLSDLRYKIEKLNDFNVNVPEQKTEVINLLHEIEGHILGNSFLKDRLADQLKKINTFTRNPNKLLEPPKRSLVWELKESVRSLDMSNFGDSIT
ncbi:hypothetical protein B0A80_19240 [Flavobacterium tructae]|uniref:hypothetical protein n=1 Tax=Flavobacterium tructae TaxID=1114873 RepID=UPI000B5BD6C9|nr:hypothetical protein [Flavobacterium tructae]OXB20233.1 hypothetical protein B0A80_19240 [Flavobacterium tructae]